MKQETSLMSEYKSETTIWGYLEPSVRALNGLASAPTKIAPDLNDVIDRYQIEVLPELEKTTQDLNSGFIENHIQPGWRNIPLSEIKAAEVQRWINGVKVSASTKSHIMMFFRRLFKKVMLWEMHPANDAGTTTSPAFEIDNLRAEHLLTRTVKIDS